MKLFLGKKEGIRYIEEYFSQPFTIMGKLNFIDYYCWQFPKGIKKTKKDILISN